MINMKATLDIPEPLYRQVKAKSALEGLTVREVAINLFSRWTASQVYLSVPDNQTPLMETPSWFAGAKRYVKEDDRHDMETIRQSINVGRVAEGKK
jgi:hypothetical protein